jgi:23S rRNA pseudouridine1911/1915/1917 synthase
MTEPQIIYEDDDFLFINKPAGLLVHPANKFKKNEFSLVHWLIKKYPEIKNVGENSLRPGIVHRLDKDTSGVMVIAKNQKSFIFLKKLFKNHQIKKTYIALVCGIPKKKEDIINMPIGLKSGTTKRTIYSQKLKKEAITYYKVLKVFKSKDGKNYSLLKVIPYTGRTHQIRVHLKYIGNCICGDNLYGKKDNFNRLMLHSFSLEFSKNKVKRLKIEAGLGKDFKKNYPQ